MYAKHVCSSEDMCVWNAVLPFHVVKFPEVPHVKGFELLCMVTVDCPSLTDIQQGGQVDSKLHLEFGLQSKAFPHTGL